MGCPAQVDGAGLLPLLPALEVKLVPQDPVRKDNSVGLAAPKALLVVQCVNTVGECRVRAVL